MYILGVWLSFSSCSSVVLSMSCGVDNSPVSNVTEGIARLETYPWLGVLYYRHSEFKFTTAVVLVTRQIVLAAATEIDKLPKSDFRAHARVTVGYNCSKAGIGVRDYTYHPDYANNQLNTLAMIQLETDHFAKELRPICPPPSHIKTQKFYAMVLSDSCKQSQIRIYEMKYVSNDECKTFYRRDGLDVSSLWPTHTTCAQSIKGDHCVWRSGAILVIKVGKRWRLLGFGVYGPGCGSPARFLDYGMHHEWVRRSFAMIGRPAITNLADNHIIIRKTQARVQRFGPCDPEEMDQMFYHENTHVTALHRSAKMNRNLSLYAGVEYSCVIVKADYNDELGKELNYETPIIHLRRWCADTAEICYGLPLLEVNLIMEVSFKNSIQFIVTAYAKEPEYIEPTKVFKYMNGLENLAFIETYPRTRASYMYWRNMGWYYRHWYPAFGRGVFSGFNLG